MRKFISILLILTLCFATLTVAADAAFENTYKNTGDMAEDIIGVANTQIGYMEGSLDGTVQGSNDCTKYGQWYGLNYNPWCAMFVSWCANQAGIPVSIIPKHASCDSGMNWFKGRSKWQYSPAYGGNYTPKISDIIYFGYKLNNGEYDSTHVGIVSRVDNTYVYVIEGNSSAKVQIVSYKLASSYILGYGTPAYTVSTPNPDPDTYPLGNYRVATTSLNVRKNPNSGADSTVLAVLHEGDVVEVTEVANEYWGKVKVSAGYGWTSLRYCEFVSTSQTPDKVFTVTFDANGGAGVPASRSVEQGKSMTLPAEMPSRSGYVFVGWSENRTATTVEYTNRSTYTPVADTTLYAVWKDYYSGYADVARDAWYRTAVEYCYRYDYMNGTSAKTFSPDMNVDRAQFIVVLGKIYFGNGGTIANSADSFDDVAADSYYAKYVAWAKKNGVVAGDDKGNFNPTQKLTREQLALILMKSASVLGVKSKTADRKSIEGFKDVSQASDWAVDGLAWACTNGFLSGADGKLMPRDNASRAQTAQIIYRMMHG